MDEAEQVELEVITEDLCAVYGCERCPGIVTGAEESLILCVHECHRADCDA